MKKMMWALAASTLVFGFGVLGCSQGSSNDVTAATTATGSDCNTLADTVGAVTLTLDGDYTTIPTTAKSGSEAAVVTFAGSEAVKVTANSSSEVRFAYLLDTPVTLTGYGTLSFKLATASALYGGYWNIALIYTDESSGGDGRVGSFYYLDQTTTTDAFTTCSFDLSADEVWGTNFATTRTLYGIQFYANTTDPVYITDLALTKSSGTTPTAGTTETILGDTDTTISIGAWASSTYTLTHTGTGSLYSVSFDYYWETATGSGGDCGGVKVLDSSSTASSEVKISNNDTAFASATIPYNSIKSIDLANFASLQFFNYAADASWSGYDNVLHIKNVVVTYQAQ